MSERRLNHDVDRLVNREVDAGITSRERSGSLGVSAKVGGALAAGMSVSALADRVRRSVMLSMALTGERYMTAGGAALYSHDDYDEAMAALNELVRRAK